VKPLVELKDVGPGPLLVKARAIVGYYDGFARSWVLGCSNDYVQGPLVGAVLKGIGQEVNENTVQVGLARKQAKRLGDVHVNDAAGLLYQLLQALHDLVDHVGQGHGLGRLQPLLVPNGEDGIHIAQHLVEVVKVGQ
jgi:hypothetical protein